MDVETLEDGPHWYAVRTHARQEGRAEGNLNAWGVETFAPRMLKRRYSNGHQIISITPLFPRYIFARFKVNDLLHKVSFTRGVEYVVNFGGQPTPVEDQIIDLIKKRVGDNGCVHIGEQFKAGDIVVVKSGPLMSLEGVFEREMKNSDRVMLLLTTISYQNHIVLERHNVQKVRAASSGA
jgi:transcriptional antiterminator RfaH